MRPLNKNRDITLAGFSWLKQFVDPRNYYCAKYVGDNKKWYPAQTNLSIVNNSKRFKSFNTERYFAHLTGDPNKALGFTNNPASNNEYYLLQFDVDFYEFNSVLANRAKSIIQKYVPDVFYENSTNCKGLHGYFLLYKSLKSAKYVRKVLDLLEKLINAEAVKVGLKAIEIMAKPAMYEWEDNIIVGVTSATPAKLPVSTDITELASSSPIDLKVLERLTWDNEEVIDDLKQGSVSFHYKNFSGVTAKIQADVLNEWGCDYQKLGRRNIYSGHVAVLTYILYFLSKQKVSYVSHSMIKYHWQELYRKGLTDLMYNKEIIIYSRNWISTKGMIEWIDNRYCMSVYSDDGEVVVQGVCCSFRLDSSLVKMLGGETGHTPHSIFDYFWGNEHKKPIYCPDLRGEHRFAAC